MMNSFQPPKRTGIHRSGGRDSHYWTVARICKMACEGQRAAKTIVISSLASRKRALDMTPKQMTLIAVIGEHVLSEP
jgi:hypothetical protein